MPTSTMQASAGVRANAMKASAVVSSKKVMRPPPLTASTSDNRPFSVSSSTILPASRMRSLKRIRCGDV